MSGVAVHQIAVFFFMATSAYFFRYGWSKGYLQRSMRIGMAAQTVFELQAGPMSFMVMTIKTGRNLAMFGMAAGAGQLGIMLGVGHG